MLFKAGIVRYQLETSLLLVRSYKVVCRFSL
jgi:hypothetical protein